MSGGVIVSLERAKDLEIMDRPANLIGDVREADMLAQEQEDLRRAHKLGFGHRYGVRANAGTAA